MGESAGVLLQLRPSRLGCYRSALMIPDPDNTGGVPTRAEPFPKMGSTTIRALAIRSSRVRLLVGRDTRRSINLAFS